MDLDARDKMGVFVRWAHWEHMTGWHMDELLKMDRAQLIELAQRKLDELKSRVVNVGNECGMDVADTIWPLVALGVIVTEPILDVQSWVVSKNEPEFAARMPHNVKDYPDFHGPAIGVGYDTERDRIASEKTRRQT